MDEIVSPAPPRKISILVLAIIFSALLTGGIVYAFQNNRSNKEREKLQSQIDVLKGQLIAVREESAKPLPTPTSQSFSNPTPSVSPAAASKPAATATPKPAAITIDAAMNACQEEPKITNLKDSRGFPFTLCATKMSVMGDLNSDGLADVVIPVASDSGKSMSELLLAAYINVNGAVKFAGVSPVLPSDLTLNKPLSFTGNGVVFADMEPIDSRGDFTPMTGRAFILKNGALVSDGSL